MALAADKFRQFGNRMVIDKDDDAVLDYTLDFTKMLQPIVDSIVTASVAVTGGLVVDSVVFDSMTITAWLSGGNLTVEGAYASATYRFTTVNNPARIDERTVYFNIKQR